MIFISYRREDSKAEVTNLYRRLVERFGEDHVFVDFNDIPPGEKWPDTLRTKLEASCVALAIIGSKWGDARFPSGKKKGRLRLDDPEDWVRQEICTAILRKNQTRVVVVPIDQSIPLIPSSVLEESNEAGLAVLAGSAGMPDQQAGHEPRRQ